MIKLYSGRENIDKERFIYDNIAGEALVLVPNQYTLVAEEQALKYLGTKCLFDVEIMSMNRLGLRVLQEQGIEEARMLDRYGRFMLLNRIIKAHKDELNIFANSVGKLTFTSMINDFISDFKQQDCSLEELKDLLAASDAEGLLKDKLSELEGIILEYEKAIEGRYTDSEDYIAKYVEAIKASNFVENKDVWVYGYDSVTPKFLSAIVELGKRAKSVNLVLNESDFGLHRSIANQLGEDIVSIGSEYALKKSETVARIERGLFSDDISAADEMSNKDFVPEDLTIIRAANPYYEAESAACYIYHLVRDLGYRMRDIQVIANDEGVMQPIIRRTFAEYGLPVFMDQTRSITDAPAVNFIVNQLWFVRYGGKTEALLAMLKTGMAGIPYNVIEDLENYARTYHIKGSMWKRPFKYGAEAYGERFETIELARKCIVESLKRMDNMLDGTVDEFVYLFKQYLNEEWQMDLRLQDFADEQVRKGMPEEAQRNIESYNAAINLLDQIVEIMGDEPMNIEEFTDIYMTGLTNVTVGVIPPTVDGLSMGTMIRTRPRAAKAVVILGANEGTLPLQPSAEGLFSVDEKEYFRDKGFALGTLDDIKMCEEQVAMYRMMSKPSEKLYISYSMTDADGKEAAPSPVIDSLLELFPRIEKDGLIAKDVISSGWSEDIVNSTAQSMRHFFNHIKDRKSGDKMDALTQAMMSWYEHNNKEDFDPMMGAALDENDPHPLGAELAKDLYARSDGSYQLSASAISGYFDCPFKYYVDRGLRPEEEREFSGDSRSIGDVYHSCLMTIAGKIIADRSYGDKLVNCSDEELRAIVGAELKLIAKEYREGLFESSEIEAYRMERILEICSVAARAIAIQLTDESVTTAKFEEGFGRGRTFKPIELEVNGSKFYVEGQIDRVDILDGDSARVIDYKTGSDKLDLEKMVQGYKMQLMIYMMSVAQDGYEPAGIYYFNIFDPIDGYNNVDENKVGKSGVAKKDAALSDAYRLKGAALTRESYDRLSEEVSHRISEIADGIAKGNVGIHPFKENNKLVCNYCSYRAICKRDRNYIKNAARG